MATPTPEPGGVHSITDWSGVVVTILATKYLCEIGWVVMYLKMDPEMKWGQVVGNIVSEWTQVLALVLMTKRLIEEKSKESRRS